MVCCYAGVAIGPIWGPRSIFAYAVCCNKKIVSTEKEKNLMHVIDV